MDKIELETSQREVLGKRVRHLRRQGITPVHVFGHGIESLALQCDTASLERVLAKAGKTSLVSLKVDAEKKTRKVMVSEVQTDWRGANLLHVDFHQVKMKEKVTADIPVVLVGHSEAAKMSGVTLEQDLKALTVECLPGDVPKSVELDISSLDRSGKAIRVEAIELPKGVRILNDPALVIVKLSAHVVKEEEKVEKVAEEVAEEKPAEEKPAGE